MFLPFTYIVGFIYLSADDITTIYLQLTSKGFGGGSVRGTVIARWTAGQEVERSFLRQKHES